MALCAVVPFSTQTLVTEARLQGFDDVLLDPTDHEIVLSVCEMLGIDINRVDSGQREHIVLAYDRAQAELDPHIRKVWA